MNNHFNPQSAADQNSTERAGAASGFAMVLGLIWDVIVDIFAFIVDTVGIVVGAIITAIPVLWIFSMNEAIGTGLGVVWLLYWTYRWAF